MLGLLFAVLAAEAHDPYQHDRGAMVDLIKQRGVTDTAVLEAMRRFPRHELVPASFRADAYGDHPLPVGHGQTISQPYIVAVMTAAARLKPGDKVLEIGTGSGYQAAILAGIGAKVFTIEIVAELAAAAQANLTRLGVKNVTYRTGDGYKGWPEEAPFAAIIVTAAPEVVPAPLLQQLKDGGRLVIPVGPIGDQNLEIHEKHGRAIEVHRSMAVRFVTMTGEASRGPKD